jgi:hypothetical protein
LAKAYRSTCKDCDWVRCRKEGKPGKLKIGEQHRKIKKDKKREPQEENQEITNVLVLCLFYELGVGPG